MCLFSYGLALLSVSSQYGLWTDEASMTSLPSNRMIVFHMIGYAAGGFLSAQIFFQTPKYIFQWTRYFSTRPTG